MACVRFSIMKQILQLILLVSAAETLCSAEVSPVVGGGQLAGERFLQGSGPGTGPTGGSSPTPQAADLVVATAANSSVSADSLTTVQRAQVLPTLRSAAFITPLYRASGVLAQENILCSYAASRGIACWSAGMDAAGLSMLRQAAVTATSSSSAVQQFCHGSSHLTTVHFDETIASWPKSTAQPPTSLTSLVNASSAADSPPVRVRGLVCGATSTCALRSDYGVECWGTLQDPKNPSTSAQATSLVPADLHSDTLDCATGYCCAVVAPALTAVQCWGLEGQIPFNVNVTTITTTYPNPILDLATSDTTVCMVMSTGSITCTTLSTASSLRAPTALSPPSGTAFRQVSVSSTAVCAVDTLGGATCQAFSTALDKGQASPPSLAAHRYVQVSVGTVASCGVLVRVQDGRADAALTVVPGTASTIVGDHMLHCWTTQVVGPAVYGTQWQAGPTSIASRYFIPLLRVVADWRGLGESAVISEGAAGVAQYVTAAKSALVSDLTSLVDRRTATLYALLSAASSSDVCRVAASTHAWLYAGITCSESITDLYITHNGFASDFVARFDAFQRALGLTDPAVPAWLQRLPQLRRLHFAEFNGIRYLPGKVFHPSSKLDTVNSLVAGTVSLRGLTGGVGESATKPHTLPAGLLHGLVPGSVLIVDVRDNGVTAIEATALDVDGINGGAQDVYDSTGSVAAVYLTAGNAVAEWPSQLFGTGYSLVSRINSDTQGQASFANMVLRIAGCASGTLCWSWLRGVGGMVVSEAPKLRQITVTTDEGDEIPRLARLLQTTFGSASGSLTLFDFSNAALEAVQADPVAAGNTALSGFSITLDSNSLSSLPTAFLQQHGVAGLSLQDNQLPNITRTSLTGASALKSLDLANNPIDYMEPGWNSGLQLTSVDISGTTLATAGCRNGTYNDESTKGQVTVVQCITCPVGHYCADGTLTACPAGYGNDRPGMCTAI